MKFFDLMLFHKFVYFTVIYLISIISILHIKYHNLKVNFFDVSLKKDFTVMTLNSSLGTIAIVIHSLLLFYYIDLLPMPIIILNILALLTYFSVTTYNLILNLKLLAKARQQIIVLESYNNNLHNSYDEIRGFKHDFDNIITTIGGFINTNDTNGLKRYYKQLNLDCQKINSLCLLNPNIINNAGIYNLLNQKYHLANSQDIKMNFSFMLDLNSLNMKVYEFARILGILIDNAIEASITSDERIINLTFRNDFRTSRQLIIIENTYSNKNIDVDKIFEKGISSKDHHTGLGLWNVKKILNKNTNINLFTSKDDKFFSQQLEIYC